MNPELLLRVFDRPIAFHRCLVPVAGSVNAALLLGQLIYWTPRAASHEGWVYKKMDELEEEIGLGRREQETARRALRERGLIHELKRGIPPQVHYQVNVSKLEDALRGCFGGKGGESASEPAELSNLADSAKLISTNPPNQFGGMRQTNTKTTTIDFTASAFHDRRFESRHGLATWVESDRSAADALTAEFPAAELAAAIEAVEVAGKEPLPGRVRHELVRVARAKRAATRQAEAAARLAPAPLQLDPAAQAAGTAILEKIRKKQNNNQGAQP